MKRTLIIVLCLTGLAFGINKTYRRPQANTVGLIAHYKLWDGLMTTGKVFDYALNGHGGALKDTNTPITLVPTWPGFDFDGSNDYIEIADHNDFSPGDGSTSTPFSISAWVYMHNATYFVWASKWQVGSNQEWNIFTGTQKKIHFRMYDDSENAYIGRQYNASLASYENQWTHFVLTYDGGILSSGFRIHLNGVRVDDADSESGNFISVENLLQPVWIGRYDTKYANGLFDNVMFFNVELSVIEVKNIYELSRWRYQR